MYDNLHSIFARLALCAKIQPISVNQLRVHITCYC